MVACMAIARHVGLSSGSDQYWTSLEQIRGAPADIGLGLWQAATRAEAEGRAGSVSEDAKAAAEEPLLGAQGADDGGEPAAPIVAASTWAQAAARARAARITGAGAPLAGQGE